MRQAGAEDGGRAQRGDRHHRAQQRRRHRLAAAATLQRVRIPISAWRAGPPRPRPGLPDGGRARCRRLRAAAAGRRAWRTAGQADTAVTAASTASTPSGEDNGSTTNCPARERPAGPRPRASAGTAASPASRAPRRRPRRSGARAQVNQHELAGQHAKRRQGMVIGPLRDRLPGDRLPDDRQRGQRGQAGQHIPADDLRPDRARDRVRGSYPGRWCRRMRPASAPAIKAAAGRPHRAAAARRRGDSSAAR